jgi:hypothetical protein
MVKYLYKLLFNVSLSEELYNKYNEFNDNKVNTLSTILCSLLLWICTYVYVIQKASINLYYNTIPEDYKGFVYINLFLFIITFVLSLKICLMNYLKARHAKSMEVYTLFVKFNVFSCFFQDLNLILAILSYSTLLILKVMIGKCQSNNVINYKSLYCNTLYDSNDMPSNVILALIVSPLAYSCLSSGTRFWAILTSYVFSAITVFYTINYMNIWNNYCLFSLYFSLSFCLIIYETERQKLQLFLSNCDLQIQIVENRRLEKETRTSEMRYMIYNLGSTIKDVSLYSTWYIVFVLIFKWMLIVIYIISLLIY